MKTFEKQTEDIFNKLPTNIGSVEAYLSVFKTMINNLFLDQASFWFTFSSFLDQKTLKAKFMLKNYILLRKKNVTKLFWTKNHVNMEVPLNLIIITVIASIHYFRINTPFFCWPIFFKEYPSPQFKINKMVHKQWWLQS